MYFSVCFSSVEIPSSLSLFGHHKQEINIDIIPTIHSTKPALALLPFPNSDMSFIFFPKKSIKFSCQASFSPLFHDNTPAFCLSGPCQTWSIFASTFRKGTLDLSLCGTSLYPAPGGKSSQKHHKRDDVLSECISGGAWWPPFHLGNSKLYSWSS